MYNLYSIKRFLTLIYLRICYKIALHRVRTSIKNHNPITVYFLVSEIAKWKAQPLYDLMECDNMFRPNICIYPYDRELVLPKSSINQLLREKEDFFRNKRMRVINIWDSQKSCVDLSHFNLEGVVFYQQPWDIPPAPDPTQIANRWLTFYVPYYLVNNYNKRLELCMPLQRQVYRYIVPSEGIKDFYLKEVCKYKFAGELVGLGHPSADNILSLERTNSDFTVIYAPHFSFPYKSITRPLYYSTFLENGEYILDYAKHHKNIKWVFKPHPRLKSELELTGAWPLAKIESYYGEWERIGEACYDSDYQSMFVNSDVLLTDCGSFLTEYACTRNPVIRLVLPDHDLLPNPVLKELYSTYYNVTGNEELEATLDIVVNRKMDPQKEKRHNAINRIEFCNGPSSERILNYLSALIFKNM